MISLKLTDLQVRALKSFVEEQAMLDVEQPKRLNRKQALVNSVVAEWYKRSLSALTFPARKGQKISFKIHEAIVMSDMNPLNGTLAWTVLYELRQLIDQKFGGATR